MKLYFALCLLFTVSLFGQRDEIIKAETDKFLKTNETQKVLYPGDPTIDIKYYKLYLVLTYTPNHYLKGNVTVNLVPVSSINKFFLDLQQPMTVDSVTINGIRDTSIIHANNIITIPLGRTYSPGELISTIIYYRGVPGSSGFGSFTFGSHNGGIPSIYTLSEPYGASDWFPCKDTPADKADSSDQWITCDSALYAVSNGKLIDIVSNPDGTKTYKWKESYPIAQYLLSLAISNFSVYTNYYKYSPVDSMPVVHHIYPETFPGAKSVLDLTPLMIKIYSDRFGQYPFIKEKYGHAQFGWGGGMEHQTCASMGSFSEGIDSHELGHQWFGDKITCRDWHHIWLNEGFATYCSCLYYEAVYGPASYSSSISSEMENAKTAAGSIWVLDTTNINEIFNPARSYSKGAAVLHMLRGITGDTVFFRILKAYIADPLLAYNSAVTEDFQRVAETVSGLNLGYFFQEWIYGENYPKYGISWNYSAEPGNLYNITLSITQQGNTNPVFFTMPVKIKITTSTGDTVFTVLNNQQSQQFNFVVSGTPSNLIFDPDNFILKNYMINNIPDELMPKAFELLQNYPNPFNPSTKIEFSIPQRSHVNIKVYNELGSEVAELLNEDRGAGTYNVDFSSFQKGRVLASGVYFYKIIAGDYTSSKKMVLLK
jgi:aminopeptidase N